MEFSGAGSAYIARLLEPEQASYKWPEEEEDVESDNEPDTELETAPGTVFRPLTMAPSTRKETKSGIRGIAAFYCHT